MQVGYTEIIDDENEMDETAPNQSSPLLGFGRLVRHLSMQGQTNDYDIITGSPISKRRDYSKNNIRNCAATTLAIIFAIALSFRIIAKNKQHEHFPPKHDNIITIDNAEEKMLDLGNDISMWFRTWGNRDGIPLLFVHGGPGNAIADYGHINAKFFDANKFWVVEADQRGTGNSQPSVRTDWRNMKYYSDITIEIMSNDYEVLRETLNIDQWLVFGGSWGSTLGLDYSERFPERCLGLIIRGIFLNTRSEFDDVYSRQRFLNNKKQLYEFDKFYDIAAAEAKRLNDTKLDPHNSERIVRLYNNMIRRGDRMAIWRWYAFENNLMEEDPSMLLSLDQIDEKEFPEACSVAFFESQLFIHGQFVEPFNLVERSKNLRNVPHTWICQGKRDQVCPQKYARHLVDKLEAEGVQTTSNFIDAPHQCTDPIMQECLIESINDFLSSMYIE